MTIFSKNVGGTMAPLAPPGYAYECYDCYDQCYDLYDFKDSPLIFLVFSQHTPRTDAQG